jgi:hypothetical protein
MGADTQAWIQLGALAAEALVWLALTMWSLERMRTHAWARPAALGAVLLLVPATTLVTARAQLLLGGGTSILEGYALSPLPTAYAVMRVGGAALLLVAVGLGRGAGRTSTA